MEPLCDPTPPCLPFPWHLLPWRIYIYIWSWGDLSTNSPNSLKSTNRKQAMPQCDSCLPKCRRDALHFLLQGIEHKTQETNRNNALVEQANALPAWSGGCTENHCGRSWAGTLLPNCSGRCIPQSCWSGSGNYEWAFVRTARGEIVLPA